MPKKLNSVVGIDVGSQQIKIAEIKLSGSEPSVMALGIAATPEGAVDHTGVYDPDQVSAVVKDLVASSGVSSPFAVVSIAGQASVLVRTLEVPRMNPQELKDHMEWEINRNIPFAESTVQSSFEAFEPSDPNAQNLDVVMAISPQSAIDTIMQVVQKSGRKLFAIDVEPLGLARTSVVSYANSTHGKTICIVDIGHNTTSINMLKDGQLLMPRPIPVGGYHITRALVDNLGIPEAEAEHLKISRARIPDSAGAVVPSFGATQGYEAFNPYGTAMPPAMDPTASSAEPTISTGASPYASPYDDPAPAQPTMAMPPAAAPMGEDPETVRIYNGFAAVLDEFLSELRRSVDYYKSKGGTVDAVYLCGGGAKLAGLPEFLTRTLDVETHMYDPLKGLTMAGKRLDHNVIQEHRSEFAVAVGNALHILF